MSVYVTEADLVQRFGAREISELTDESAAQSPDTDEVDKACEEATSLIDSYLSVRYTLPLETVPTIVRKWACDIARKYLWKDRASPDGVITENYHDALAQLKDVAKGVMGLPDAAGVVTIVTGGLAYGQPESVFDTTGLL